MHTLAGCREYADFLEAIPAFSSCTRDVLEDFVDHHVVKVHCVAGKKLSPLTEQEQNLYVLASGSAQLKTDDTAVDLEAGDYFGKSSDRRHYIVASVVALTDIEILVVNPDEVDRLRQSSSRDRHPSKINWRMERLAAPRQPLRLHTGHGRTVLAGKGV